MNPKVVSIILKVRDQASGAFRKGRESVNRFAASISGKLMAAFTAFFAVFGARKLLSIGTAAEETASKFRTTFGPDISAALDSVATEYARFIGLNRTAARDVLATTGSIVQGMGFSQEASAAFSEEILRLSGDLGSFHNAQVEGQEGTARAIQAALTGEREGLKKYGIVINEAMVQQRAFALTGKDTASALTQQEKAVATLQLAYERAGPAVGDVERTQGSLANRLKRAKADFEGIVETVAVNMLPAFSDLLEIAVENREAFVLVGDVAVWVVGKFRDLIREVKLIGAELPVAMQKARVAWLRFRDAIPFAGDLSDQVAEAERLLGHLTTAAIETQVAIMNGTDGARNDALPDRVFGGLEAVLAGAGGEGAGGGEDPAFIARTIDGLERTQEHAALLQDRLEEVREKLGTAEADALLAPTEEAAEKARAKVAELASELAVLEEVQARVFSADESVEARTEFVRGFELPEIELPTLEALIPEEFATWGERFAEQAAIGAAAMDDLSDRSVGYALEGIYAFGDATAASFAAMVDGSRSAGDAFKGAMLGAIAGVAQREGDLAFAKGVAALGTGLLGDPKGFAAAAKYFAAGTAFYAISGAIGGASRGAGGGLSSAGFSSRQSDLDSAIQERETEIIIQGGLLDMSDPRQAGALADAIRSLSGRRVRISEA